MECPECQTEIPDNANFCLKCGYALGEKEQQPKPSFIRDAERKRITALFSDLSGYTAMTEKLDPEDVKDITSNIFTGVKDIINKYEGFLEKFAGDGVLALFGVPKTHEDDPIRAIRAALEIHEFVEKLNPRYESKVSRPLCMHSGINTGLAVTVDVNPVKGTHGVTGDVINVAARLSDMATAGEILVGSDTYKATHSNFTFQSIKPTVVKGKSKPIRAYKVMPEKMVSADVHQKMLISSEMVGRDQELAKLELHILKVVNGQGSVINIFGEPGIGKSRLLAELRKRDVITRVSFLEGRSISIGKNLSFHPIIDLFKHWAKIKEDDTKIEASDKLEFAIRNVCGDDADEVFPFVATMLGMKLSGKPAQRVEGIEGDALEKFIFKNVRDLLIRSTEIIPIVIVMEDLHWADTTSLNLLESLFRLALTHRVVFFNVFRPGYWQEPGRKVIALSQWLPDVDFAELSLKPLDKRTGEILVDKMLQAKGLRIKIKQQIVDRAGGNPFFIEEVARSFIEEGAIVRTNGAFEVTDKINHMVIPPTINDVLLSRIDRLEEQTRELIKIASVIGRNFFDRILKEVATSVDGVDDRLAYLKDTQFIRDRIRMEELEYLFKHALAQEAAYESTLIQQRKTLHQEVAKAIEKIFTERLHEFYGMLAFHYSKAEEPEKTEEYMMKAGEEALRSSASDEALHFYKEALRLYLDKYGDRADSDKLSILEKNIGIALFNKGDYKDALVFFDTVLRRWGYPLQKKSVAGIIKFIWNLIVLLKMVYWRLPNSNRIPNNYDIEAFELICQTGEALTHVDNTTAFLSIMEFYRHIKKFDPSKTLMAPRSWAGLSAGFSASGLSFKLSNRMYEIANTFALAEDIRIRLKILGNGYCNYCHQGDWKKINDLDEDLLTSSLSIGDFFSVGFCFWFIGIVKGEQGEFDQLLKIIDRMNGIGEEYGSSIIIIEAQLLKTDYFLKKRSVQEALSTSDLGISLSRESGTELNEILFLGFKAEAQLMAGNTKGASDSIIQASKIIENNKSTVFPFFSSSYKIASFILKIEKLKKIIHSDSSLDKNHAQKLAYKAGKNAVKNSRTYAPYRTKTFKVMGEYFWLIGKQTKALKWWGKAIKDGEHLNARIDLSRTYFEVGKRLLEPHSRYKQHNGVYAKDYLDKARAMFEEMDLQRDIDELDRITQNS